MPPQECLNLFHETSPIPSSNSILIHTPALSSHASVGSGPIRAIIYSDGTLSGGVYVISGSEIYSLASGVATLIVGNLPDGSVSWAASAIEIAVCIGDKGYIIDGSGVNLITDTDFPSVSSVAHINGYFLWTSVNGQFIWSEILDGQDYDALNFATAEKAPDGLIAVKVDHEQVMLFGSSTIEVWVPTGNALSAFEPIPGGLQQRGLASRDSLVQMDNSLFFVGDDKLVYRLDANNPVRVSHFAIEEQLSAMSWGDRAGIKGMTYAHDGHTFYIIEIPNKGTWAFDVATGTWHKRQSEGLVYWGANVLTTIAGDVFAGDRTSGFVYTLSHSEYEDRYGYIERLVTGGVTLQSGVEVVQNLVLDITSGDYPLSGQGSEPKVMMRYSDDLGNTWSDEKTRTIGKTGVYNKRPRWNRLRSVRSPGRVYEFRITDPIPVIIYGARQNINIP